MLSVSPCYKIDFGACLGLYQGFQKRGNNMQLACMHKFKDTKYLSLFGNSYNFLVSVSFSVCVEIKI